MIQQRKRTGFRSQCDGQLGAMAGGVKVGLKNLNHLGLISIPRHRFSRYPDTVLGTLKENSKENSKSVTVDKFVHLPHGEGIDLCISPSVPVEAGAGPSGAVGSRHQAERIFLCMSPGQLTGTLPTGELGLIRRAPVRVAYVAPGCDPPPGQETADYWFDQVLISIRFWALNSFNGCVKAIVECLARLPVSPVFSPQTYNEKFFKFQDLTVLPPDLPRSHLLEYDDLSRSWQSSALRSLGCGKVRAQRNQAARGKAADIGLMEFNAVGTAPTSTGHTPEVGSTGPKPPAGRIADGRPATAFPRGAARTWPQPRVPIALDYKRRVKTMTRVFPRSLTKMFGTHSLNFAGPGPLGVVRGSRRGHRPRHPWRGAVCEHYFSVGSGHQ